jgi:hypothetical protein
MRLPFGPFLPDQLPVGADRLVRAQNVFPAADGYRACPGFLPISSALPAEFRGGASFISESGAAYLLAGTATTLSQFTAGGWTSLVASLTVTKRWRFAQFGNFVIAVNGGDTQEVDLDAGTAGDLTGAPSAIDVDVIGPHVVYAQPNGDLLRVRWSAFEDHTGNTLGLNQAGDQPMLTGGEVQGIAGGEFGVILQRQRLVRMSLTGDANAPFQFDEITPNFGCAAKGSIAKAGRTVFCLSDRGFIAIDNGQSIRPIGNEKFDVSFREALGEDDFDRVWSTVDPQRTIVAWGIAGTPGQIWIYNWVLDRASVLRLPFDGIFAGFESSQTLEQLNVEFPDLDAMTVSLDDPRFQGGAPRLYVVQDGRVGVLAGPNLTARLRTAQFPPYGDNVTRLRAVWPDTDAVSGVTAIAEGSQRRGDVPTVRSNNAMQESGRIPLQARGKQMAFEVRIASPVWSYVNGVTLEADPGGLR